MMRFRLTVEWLTEVLDEAESNGIIGPDYTPSRLAEYILARLPDDRHSIIDLEADER